MKKFVGSIVSAILVLVPVSPVAATSNATTLRVYSSLPLTGSSASQTIPIVNAIRMAISQQTTNNGEVCNGQFKIDYVSLDDATAAAGKWDAAKEQENANLAKDDTSAIAYIGTFNSGASKVSIPILNQANLAMISPGNTYPGLTRPGAAGEPDKYYPTGKRNFMRVIVSDDFQGITDASWAKSLNAKTIYLLHDTESYGKELADNFRSALGRPDFKEVGYEGIDSRAISYTVLATKIKAATPDLIYFGGITQNNAGQLIKDIRGAGITATFMGGDGILDSGFIASAGSNNAEGALATLPGVISDTLPLKGKQFYTDYQTTYHTAAETYAIYGYEAMSVVIAAAKSVCAVNRDAFRVAMLSTKDFDGVLGRWSFDALGDISLRTFQQYKVQSGFWKRIGSIGTTPSVELNYATGSPGSQFEVNIVNYPPSGIATISLNGRTLTPTITLDLLGFGKFLLDTNGADNGRYVVSVSVNPVASAAFELGSSYPLRTASITGTTFVVPSGIALIQKYVFLPIIIK